MGGSPSAAAMDLGYPVQDQRKVRGVRCGEVPGKRPKVAAVRRDRKTRHQIGFHGAPHRRLAHGKNEMIISNRER